MKEDYFTHPHRHDVGLCGPVVIVEHHHSQHHAARHHHHDAVEVCTWKSVSESRSFSHVIVIYREAFPIFSAKKKTSQPKCWNMVLQYLLVHEILRTFLWGAELFSFRYWKEWQHFQQQSVTGKAFVMQRRLNKFASLSNWFQTICPPLQLKPVWRCYCCFVL